MKKWIIPGLCALFAFSALLNGGFFAGLIALLIGALFLPIPAWQESVEKYVAKKLKKFVAIGLSIVFLATFPTGETSVESDVDRNISEVVTEVAVTTEQKETVALPVIEEVEESSVVTGVESTTETTTAPTTVATTAPTTQSTTAPTTEATTEATTAPTTQATTVPTTVTTTKATEAEEYDYVINTNKGKFHYPSCSSVKQMKEEHKMYFTGSREELIAMQYSPCGNCHP